MYMFLYTKQEEERKEDHNNMVNRHDDRGNVEVHLAPHSSLPAASRTTDYILPGAYPRASEGGPASCFSFRSA
jgi:hypothetical protein